MGADAAARPTTCLTSDEPELAKRCAAALTLLARAISAKISRQRRRSMGGEFKGRAGASLFLIWKK